jgi:hypothetical protein
MRGYINPFVAAPVALGVLVGAAVGTRIMMRTRSTWIRRLFVLVLMVVAVQMLAKAVGLK